MKLVAKDLAEGGHETVVCRSLLKRMPHGDRRKSSALVWYAFLWPFLLLGRLKNGGRIQRKNPGLAAENAAWINAVCGTEMLLARTAILSCRRPRTDA